MLRPSAYAATYQLLSVLGSRIACSVSTWIGARQIFFLDAISGVADLGIKYVNFKN
ncbi:hypothetical protein HCU40_18845 (plasmid) [Pseudanabaena biceps]|nr:hypothetical protein [Pseudanabaena biceps]